MAPLLLLLLLLQLLRCKEGTLLQELLSIQGQVGLLHQHNGQACLL
jgi:hypothetical protein